MCHRIFKEQTSETGDIPFYKIGTFGAEPDAFISRELFEEYKSKYPYPQKGDILISASGSIGRTLEFTGDSEYFQDSNIVWLNHDERLSNLFLKCFYSVVKWDGIEGSTIKRLYNDNILKTVICMPSVSEQEYVGIFFENLDNLITLHQCKCNYLLRLKDCIFSFIVKTTWEQRKVNEICSISTGKSNTQDKIDDGKYPFYVRSPIIERSNRYLYDEEAVLTVGDGVGTGKVFHYVNGKYDIHQRVYRLFDFSDDIDAKFFYHWFSENFYNRVMYMTAKTSVDSVRLEMIADMEITAPSYDEQKKISSYLDNFDNLITLHQSKLKLLKQIKQSMENGLFIKNTTKNRKELENMTFKYESDFEETLINLLSNKGWEKDVIKYPTESELLQNWANILFDNNRGIDRLNNYPLTEGEMQQVLEQINSLRTPIKLNEFINGKTVSIKRDNPDDLEHLGKEISLKIYDRREIAAGQSRYQIVQQPVFPSKTKILNDRRGDLMLLINGMPVIHIELKKSGVPVSQACNQIEKYSKEGIFTGLFSLIQVFVAMTPNETRYFANPGPDGRFNSDY